jgi:hypothetical protein
MPCAHAELERRRFARYPAEYAFRVIDATALYRGEHVERPENPAKNFNDSTIRLVVKGEWHGYIYRVRQGIICICKESWVGGRTHRAKEMKIDWSATRMPGQMRRPNPKGIAKSLSTLPFQFPAGFCGVKNREGSNVSGSSNRFGSLTRTL